MGAALRMQAPSMLAAQRGLMQYPSIRGQPLMQTPRPMVQPPRKRERDMPLNIPLNKYARTGAVPGQVKQMDVPKVEGKWADLLENIVSSTIEKYEADKAEKEAKEAAEKA